MAVTPIDPIPHPVQAKPDGSHLAEIEKITESGFCDVIIDATGHAGSMVQCYEFAAVGGRELRRQPLGQRRLLRPPRRELGPPGLVLGALFQLPKAAAAAPHEALDDRVWVLGARAGEGGGRGMNPTEREGA